LFLQMLGLTFAVAWALQKNDQLLQMEI